MKLPVSVWIGVALLVARQGSCGGQSCPPEVQWQNRLSAVQGLFTSVQNTSDGGLIVGGLLTAEPNGFLTVRLDANGVKLWQRYYGAGSLRSVRQTSDGGFILAGSVWQSHNGFGAGDFKVVKVNANGDQLWDRIFGGSWNEDCEVVRETRDGGFLIGGSSVSQDATGNKTSPNRGAWDMWVVRIDANGNQLWDQSYGGSANDDLSCLELTSDGGFILGGTSHSPPDGNKSSPQWGNGDVWILQVDANGNKLWDRSYGGTGFDGYPRVSRTPDGGFAVSTISDSGADGTKTSPSFGTFDFWILRLDDNGNELWQRAFGGSGPDYARQIQTTDDGGFIVGGSSYSPYAEPSGNKTSPYFGNFDFWVLRLDARGAKRWEAAFGSRDYDDLWASDQTSDGGFILAGRSESSPWLIKLAPESPDCDNDGVPNVDDLCQDTPAGSIIDSSGCSIEQICPCEAPWKNHAQYVKCVMKQAAKLKREQRIDEKQRQFIVKQARQSTCGNRRL